LGETPCVIFARKTIPANDLRELIVWLKANPNKASAGIAAVPDIPTIGEMGLPALSYSGWYGFFAPKETPRDVIGKLNAAAAEALADPAMRSRFVDLGFQLFPRERQTPDALGALVKTSAEKWWPIIKAAGIKAE
jgi:tripartite-type tricarboxylate transporter receptor subunit TctC